MRRSASQQIVRTIIDLCRNMEINCVAEGIETTNQMLALQMIECRHMQGYLFARPMTASDVAPFLLKEILPPRELLCKRA